MTPADHIANLRREINVAGAEAVNQSFEWGVRWACEDVSPNEREALTYQIAVAELRLLVLRKRRAIVDYKMMEADQCPTT